MTDNWPTPEQERQMMRDDAEALAELASAAREEASRGDSDWFEARPERVLRLRLEIPGEWPDDVRTTPPAGHDALVIVRRLGPGLRARMPYSWPRGMPLPASDDAILPLLRMAQGDWLGRIPLQPQP